MPRGSSVDSDAWSCRGAAGGSATRHTIDTSELPFLCERYKRQEEDKCEVDDGVASKSCHVSTNHPKLLEGQKNQVSTIEGLHQYTFVVFELRDHFQTSGKVKERKIYLLFGTGYRSVD